ncbi:MAG: NADH:ubiquinone reductase (Na(+)-transporting) subunit B [Simkaniaceae bacterium]|nr:NADH:ubiquinone reductase (Na(+)-transporting) subunit B [Simkaniaceae bacterium]
MIRKLLNWQLKISEEGKPLARLRPLFSALDAFVYEVPIETSSGPAIRDSVDIKRVMMLVFYALLPCTIMAVINSGTTGFVYGSGSGELMQAYMQASGSLGGYFSFLWAHLGSIIYEGMRAFLPVLIITYIVGGFWEALFACIRGHEISEGFLVTGILFALIMPPTIPYWLIVVGVSFGIVVGKELFGGTGMNILNPALTCRAFLYFAYPNKMTGDIWVGTNPTTIRESLLKIEGVTQATMLNILNASSEIKRVHVEAIGKFLKGSGQTLEQIELYVTEALKLPQEYFGEAYQLARLQFGEGIMTNGNFFFGNMLGSFGETSVLACLIGAVILLVTRVASWRTMAGVVIGAYATALLFEYGAIWIGDMAPAKYAFPAYKHFLIGSLAFGLVFMATDPVSSPTMNSAKWAYGVIIGILTLVIRIVNPAFPEGVMLAILFGNVFAPLLDKIALKQFRRFRHV